MIEAEFWFNGISFKVRHRKSKFVPLEFFCPLQTLRTPLHLAAEEGHHDIVSILLDNNAEFNEQDEVFRSLVPAIGLYFIKF